MSKSDFPTVIFIEALYTNSNSLYTNRRERGKIMTSNTSHHQYITIYYHILSLPVPKTCYHSNNVFPTYLTKVYLLGQLSSLQYISTAVMQSSSCLSSIQSSIIGILVVATTCQNGTCSMLTLAKLSVGYLVVGITRELDKKSSLY